MCIVLLLAGIIFALTMFFNIDEITVTGDTVYSAEDIKTASGVSTGDNLIFISADKISTSVSEKLPYVGSVKIKRHLPTGLELIITKTEAAYAIAADGYYTLLDSSAKVLEKELETVGENITLVNLGEITSAEPGKPIETENTQFLTKLQQIHDALSKCGLSDITSIDMSDIYNIKLLYQGRITLMLGDTDKSVLQKKLELGKSAIEDQNKSNPNFRGSINLTVAGKAYLAEETQTTQPPVEPPTDEANSSPPDSGEESSSTEPSSAEPSEGTSAAA